MEANPKFPVLSTLSFILCVAGWFSFLPGLYLGVYEGIIEPRAPGHVFGQTDMLQLVGGGAIVVVGLILMVLGEIIGVLFAIEQNTRKDRSRFTE